MGFAADQLDSVCISFDKLDKIGADGVKKELLEKEFDAAAVEALDEFLRAGDFSLDAVTARVGDETLTADLRYVIATAEKDCQRPLRHCLCPQPGARPGILYRHGV